MTARDDAIRESCFDAAVQFVADQPGGADRTLARHRRLPDGTCAGCLSTWTRWPCTAAAIAQKARHHPMETPCAAPHTDSRRARVVP